MDLVVYKPFDICRCDFSSRSSWLDMVEWLCLVHRVNEDKIKSWLDGLKRKGLLQDIDWTSGKINLHDLYMEFAVLESRGMLNESMDFENRRYMRTSMSDLTELERSPSGACWPKLTRVNIHDIKGEQQVMDQIISLHGINWLFYSNVVVLELENLSFIRESLDLKGLTCLRSLAMWDIVGLNRLEGLDGLKYLTFFKWEKSGWPSNYPYSSIVGQLPSSLKVFEVKDRILLNPCVLVRCNSLVKLKLAYIQYAKLDLSSCSKLQSVSMENVKNLTSMRLPRSSRGVCGLKSLEVQLCNNLANILELDELIGLEQLVVRYCPRYELPDLRNLTELQVLELAGGEALVGCCIPRELRELKYGCYSSKPPSVRGCKQLEVLDLRFFTGGKVGKGSNLEDLEDLPALRHLKLHGCRLLSGWPDLRKSKKLEVIRISMYDGCEVELQENDIRMLVSLPLLQPIEILKYGKLDLRRRKVLRT